ncbi:hypothetical protein NON19_30135 [Streptomyces rubrisoli]|uniref:Uncharacterized protein n=1 Tax=Streptantibioticus rubrisoli TaxID=1387313 RepID=A0ABT1PLF6_9ACTN|nr:hypothetical protein [Streptantibioticus rubrisoli]MCQ4046189.1 hypothetical protein [Streptantibioticus rubrisoli]
MKSRLVIGALGLAAMGIGLSILLTDPYVRDPLDVVWWLAGAVLLHDGVLVPVVLVAGAALRVPRWMRGPLRGGLIAAGCVAAVALPAVLRPGPVANPSVLPLDYGRGLLIATGAVAAATAVAAVRSGVRSRREAAGSGDGPDLGDTVAVQDQDVDAALGGDGARGVGYVNRPAGDHGCAAEVHHGHTIHGVPQPGGGVPVTELADEGGDGGGPAEGVGGFGADTGEVDAEIGGKDLRGER